MLSEKAPNDQSVDALADPVSTNISTVTTVALVNPVTFAWPSLNLISLSTSDETNVLALAVKVLPVPTVCAEAVIVVVDVLVSKYGPLVKSTVVNVQAVWPVLDNFFVSWLGCVMYITSALCANLISNSSAVKYGVDISKAEPPDNTWPLSLYTLIYWLPNSRT